MSTSPAAHEAHDLPLLWRLIDEHVGRFLATGFDLAAAGSGTANEFERGKQAAIEELRHLHLSGHDYKVTPKLADAIRRAGLLRE